MSTLRSGPLLLQAVLNLSSSGHVCRLERSWLPHGALAHFWWRLRELTAVSVSTERADRGEHAAHVRRDAVLRAGGVTRMLWHHLAITLAFDGGVMGGMVVVHGAQWGASWAWGRNVAQIAGSLSLWGRRAMGKVIVVASWSVEFALILWTDAGSGLSIIVHHRPWVVNWQYFT